MIAIVAGLVFALVGFSLVVFGQFLIAVLADHLRAVESIEGFSLPVSNSPFYLYLVLGLCFAAGLSVAVFLWIQRPGYWKRFIVYVLILAILLPISGYNYAHFDYLINRGAQAVFNIVLIFCGSVIVAELLRLRATANDLLILQLFAVFALTLTAVILPLAFSVIWLINQLGVIDRQQANNMSLPTVGTLSGLLSAIVAYLKFRHETESKALPPNGSPG